MGSFGAIGNSDLPEKRKEGRKEGKGKSLTDLEGKGKMKENAQILPPRLQDFKPVLPSFSVCDVYYTHLFVQTFNKLSVIFGGFFPLIPV